jgi:hypothetical protein
LQPRSDRTPTAEEAFEAFRTLVAYCVDQRGAARALFDQRPGHLPPDAMSADAYKRWHRRARRAEIAGVSTRGKLLLATPKAWATPIPGPPRACRTPTSADNNDDALDAALGIRRLRGAQ